MTTAKWQAMVMKRENMGISSQVSGKSGNGQRYQSPGRGQVTLISGKARSTTPVHGLVIRCISFAALRHRRAMRNTSSESRCDV
jgi:hypothetical protein